MLCLPRLNNKHRKLTGQNKVKFVNYKVKIFSLGVE